MANFRFSFQKCPKSPVSFIVVVVVRSIYNIPIYKCKIAHDIGHIFVVCMIFEMMYCQHQIAFNFKWIVSSHFPVPTALNKEKELCFPTYNAACTHKHNWTDERIDEVLIRKYGGLHWKGELPLSNGELLYCIMSVRKVSSLLFLFTFE